MGRRSFMSTTISTTMSLNLKRTATVLKPNQSRVLLRPFNPGDHRRVRGIVGRIMSLPEDQVRALEKREFMKLVHTPETIARIATMLETGKPLRN